MKNRHIKIKHECCIHCGVCTAACRAGALFLDKETWKLCYEQQRCSGCGLCAENCPMGAIKRKPREGYVCI